jgi:hypothetical protein
MKLEKKQLFEKYLNKPVVLTIKPNSFVLVGQITGLFEDCFEFTTATKSSLLDYNLVFSLREA